jgi:O-antigen/teichoic acid export membrane protein
MAIKHKLVSNTTYLFLNWASVTAFSLGFWLLMGKTLSPSSYGVVSVFLQVATFLSGVAALGLNSTIVKLVAEFLERKQMGKVQGIIMFSFKSVIAASLLISVALVAMSGELAPLLKMPVNVLMLAAASVTIISTTTLFDFIYYGFQRMKRQFVTNLVGGVSKIAFAAAFIFLGLDYVGATLALVLSYLAILISRLERRMFRMSEHPIVDRAAITKFAVPAFIVFICTTIFTGSQYVMLSVMKTTEDAGLMSIAMQVPSVISTVSVIFFLALISTVSGLSAGRNPKPMQSYLVKLVFRYDLFIMVPMAAFMVVLSKYAVLFFASPQYLPAADLLAVMAVATALYGLCGLLMSSMYSIGRPDDYMKIQVGVAVLYMALAVPLTYYFSAMGMAVAYLLSNLAFFAVGVLRLRKYLDFAVPLADVGRIAAATAISVALLAAATPYIHGSVVAIAAAALAGGVYMAVMLPMKFYINEDLIVFDVIAEKTPFMRWPLGLVKGIFKKFVNRSYKDVQRDRLSKPG